jgi:hypothetical protein
MVTRDEIEAEAAFIRHLIDMANPTGGPHTPTPWQAKPAVAHSAPPGEHAIVESGGHIDWQIAVFQNEADRDLALYFVNAHAGMLALLRSHAEAFAFIAKGTDDKGLRDFANHMAELANIYHAGFASMGATFAQAKAPDAEPEHTYPSLHDPRALGARPAIVAAFAIMDLLKPGAISHTARIYLAGLIAGVIDSAYEQGADGERLEFDRSTNWPRPT